MLHALVVTSGLFARAAWYLGLSKGQRDIEVASRGWSAADDRALLAAARGDGRGEGAGALPGALRGRRAEEVEARCSYLGCVVPRVLRQRPAAA